MKKVRSCSSVPTWVNTDISWASRVCIKLDGCKLCPFPRIVLRQNTMLIKKNDVF